MAESVTQNIKILIGITGSTGESVFSLNKTFTEAQSELDAFTSTNNLSFGSLTSTNNFEINSLDFENDIMIVKVTEASAETPFYNVERNSSDFEVVTFLEYNYNMTTASVDTTLNKILNNITKELTPPTTSRTFAYDFKFSRNRNGSITTGSVAPVRSRAPTTSGGGGY